MYEKKISDLPLGLDNIAQEIEVHRSLCYNIHAFDFEKFLSTSQT